MATSARVFSLIAGRLSVIRMTVGEQHQSDGRGVDAVFFHPFAEALEAWLPQGGGRHVARIDHHMAIVVEDPSKHVAVAVVVLSRPHIGEQISY